MLCFIHVNMIKDIQKYKIVLNFNDLFEFNKYDLYANIRPAKSSAALKTRFENIDIITFRENTEDLYIGEEMKISDDEVHAIKKITRFASERIIRAAFDYAIKNDRKKVTCVHKANILKQSDGMFLAIFNEIKNEYPSIR